jgi:hypothetical protein
LPERLNGVPSAGPADLAQLLATRFLATACLAAAVLVHGALAATSDQRAQSAPRQLPMFRDVARAVGLDFVHVNGASERRFLPEIVGSGGLFFDFDHDGWLDIFIVDGGSFADAAIATRARHRLYRNRRNGTFEDLTAASGIRHREYGMGACAGDYDNDGLIDLYVTGVGSNQLYRNAGHQRFTEVPNAGGANPRLWSTSCAFLDIDRDGDLDIFVTNYVDPVQNNNHFCGIAGSPPLRDYCHPLIYQPLHSVLYRNTGPSSLGAGKTFEDVSTSSGVGALRGNGLGVAIADIDDDGWSDVFVANDAMPNFLFHNDGDGTFTDIGGAAGVAATADGKAKAGMGTAFGDLSGTGRLGLIVTNHETEMHSLFLNIGGGLFSDVTVRSGVGPATRPYVGFGVALFDYDNDTLLDLAIANGHVMAHAARLRGGGTFAQRNLLLRNVGLPAGASAAAGGRFQDVKEQAGPGFSIELVSRGLAAGDVDNDGDLDLLVTNNGGPVNLLLNDGGSTGAILVQAIGTKSNRSGIGTRLIMTAGGRRQLREVQSGSSYLGQNDLRAHFGLGAAGRAERLEVRWPSGVTEVIEDLPANHVITLREGDGVVGRVPFRR